MWTSLNCHRVEIRCLVSVPAFRLASLVRTTTERLFTALTSETKTTTKESKMRQHLRCHVKCLPHSQRRQSKKNWNLSIRMKIVAERQPKLRSDVHVEVLRVSAISGWITVLFCSWHFLGEKENALVTEGDIGQFYRYIVMARYSNLLPVGILRVIFQLVFVCTYIMLCLCRGAVPRR